MIIRVLWEEEKAAADDLKEDVESLPEELTSEDEANLYALKETSDKTLLSVGGLYEREKAPGGHSMASPSG